jgi:hypothetical protein
MPRHDCLPPHRTGREDFPHPALTQTLAAQQYTGAGRLSSAAQLRSKMRTVPPPCGRVSVGGLSSKRNSHPLIQHVGVPAPSLHGRYPLPRYYEPVRFPTRPSGGYGFPPDVGSRRLAGSPRFLDRSVLTRRLLPPRKVRRVLLPVASPSMSGFTTVWRAGHLPWHNGAESSSLALRLASSPQQGFARADCSPLALAGLLVERVIYKVNSSQFTRSARLILALQTLPFMSATVRKAHRPRQGAGTGMLRELPERIHEREL